MGKKKLSYNVLEDDSLLDLSVALSQASVLLDLAAVSSIKNNNVKQMISIADQWVKIGALLTPSAEDSEVVDTKDSVPYGFSMDREEVTNGTADNENISDSRCNS